MPELQSKPAGADLGYYDDLATASKFLKGLGIDDGELHRLQDAAVQQLKHSYCPYSNFPVGAAILFQTGEGSQSTIFPGCNVENAAFGPSLCAERNAIGAAVARGGNPRAVAAAADAASADGLRGKFAAVCVAAPTAEPCTPCGMCRQVIREFCALETPVIMVYGSQKDKFFIRSLGELLPHSFGPDALELKS